ncbi:MAG: outer membrane protein assembly factor BamD, partial [Rickettsiales bacterium]|jgi:outer membrane protein assembly factor BamD|nr:outer membrane protein assembly factor BamD [Rickettsiales bacterium]
VKKSIVSCLAAIFLSACGGGDISGTKSLGELYDGAYKKLGEKNYAEAAAMFTEAESSHPTSPWAADALVMAAYSQYLDRDFAATITTIDRFMRFHPGHKDADYMLYLRGMCFYRQVSDVRREPGMGRNALAAFGQLVQRFPNSEYAKNADNKIVILKNHIAGKIMYSARRDLLAQNYPVAIANLQSLITNMQETKMTPEALFRLNEAYTAMGLPEQAAGYREMLRLNFPDNEWSGKL